MYCASCGAEIPDNAKFCTACGSQVAQAAPQPQASQAASQPRAPQAAPQPVQRIGYSTRINDPAFAKYVKHTKQWAMLFAVILAVIAVVAAYIAGEKGWDNMSNPESLYIGLGVGGMFIAIALFTNLSRKRLGTTWDGTVVDKKVKKKTRHDDDGSEDYLEYTVFIRSDQGKRHTLKAEDDDTVYNYYKIGDRVRHHSGLNSYEKYDKTGDKIIFCNACASLCDIEDEYCFRCKCPLLK